MQMNNNPPRSWTRVVILLVFGLSFMYGCRLLADWLSVLYPDNAILLEKAIGLPCLIVIAAFVIVPILREFQPLRKDSNDLEKR